MKRIHQRVGFYICPEMIELKILVLWTKQKIFLRVYRIPYTSCSKTYDVLFLVIPPIIITSVPYVIVIKLIRPCLSWPKFFHTSFSKIAIVFLGNSFLSQHPPRMKTLPGLATGNEFWILFKRTFHTKKRWLQPMTETITESIFEVTDFVWVIYTIYSQIPFISCAKIKY